MTNKAKRCIQLVIPVLGGVAGVVLYKVIEDTPLEIPLLVTALILLPLSLCLQLKAAADEKRQKALQDKETQEHAEGEA